MKDLLENWREYLKEQTDRLSIWDALLGLRDFKGATASGIYGNKVRPITYLAADSGGYGNVDLYASILKSHFPAEIVTNAYKILDLIKSEIGEREPTEEQLQQLSSKYNIPAYIKYENASKALQEIINSPYRGPKPLYRGLGITLSPQDMEIAKNDPGRGGEIIKNSRKGRPGYDINWIISKKATSWSFEKSIAGMFATSPAPHSRLDYDEGKKKYVPVILVLEDPKQGLLMDFGEVSEDTESEAILPNWQFTDPLEYEISGPMDMIFIKVVQK